MWFRCTACDLELVNIYFSNELRFIDRVPAHAPRSEFKEGGGMAPLLDLSFSKNNKINGAK